MSAATSSNPFAIAVAWTLVNGLWQAAAAWLLYAGCTRSTRDPAFRSALAQGLLVTLVCAQLLTLAYLVGRDVRFDPVAAVLRDAAVPPMPDAAGIVPLLARAEPGPLRRAVVALEPWLPAVASMWLAVVAAQLCLAARDWHALSSILRSARPIRDDVRSRYERFAGLLRLRRPVRFLESPLIGLPATARWRRPAVLTPPPHVLAVTARELELLVVHELAHVARGDALHAVVRAAVVWLYGWHPAVRALARHALHAAEEAADDLAASAIGDRLGYARALLNAEDRRPDLPMALSAGGGSLGVRLRRLVQTPGPGLDRSRGARLGATLIVGPLLFAGAAAFAASEASERRGDAWLQTRGLQAAVLETIAPGPGSDELGAALEAALVAVRNGDGRDVTARTAALDRAANAAVAGFDPHTTARFRTRFSDLSLGARRRLSCGEFGAAVEREELSQALLQASVESADAPTKQRYARASLVVASILPEADFGKGILRLLGDPRLYGNLGLTGWEQRRLYEAGRLHVARSSAIVHDLVEAERGEPLTDGGAAAVAAAAAHAPYLYEYWAARVAPGRRVAAESAR